MRPDSASRTDSSSSTIAISIFATRPLPDVGKVYSFQPPPAIASHLCGSSQGSLRKYGHQLVGGRLYLSIGHAAFGSGLYVRERDEARRNLPVFPTDRTCGHSRTGAFLPHGYRSIWEASGANGKRLRQNRSNGLKQRMYPADRNDAAPQATLVKVSRCAASLSVACYG